MDNPAYTAVLPGGRLLRYPHDVCWGMVDQLKDAVDKKGRPLRDLTPQEQGFITNERLLSKIDYRHWAERYCKIAKESADLAPLYPMWASQDLFLERIAAIEHERWQAGHPDGILVNVLKARQLGISTKVEVILAHRTSTQGTVRGIIAGDVEEQSKYLMSMAELVIDELPWWLKPGITAHQRGELLQFDTGAFLRSAWGKSSRGGLKDKGGVKGNIGRGKTFTLGHLSEISTWERPEQIDDGLLPGVPRTPRVFLAEESTAKGRYDYWHTHWNQAERGIGRFVNVFIPWYIEPDKYWLPAPEGWEPLPTTVAHAADVERTSPHYLLGRTYRLSKEQLYWYESTRRAFDDEGAGSEFAQDGRRLPTFYEEYPATAEEAFQHAGRSIFGRKLLDRLSMSAKTPISIYIVDPLKEIQQLREWERQRATAQAALEAEEAEKRKAQGITRVPTPPPAPAPEA
jgi:hypothetical protein